MSQSKIKTVERAIAKLREEQRRLEAEEFKARLVPDILASVGKTYAYRKNCYSCPEKPSDYWDVFRRLVRFRTGELYIWAIFQEVEIDSRGVPSMRLAVDLLSNPARFPKNGWQECPVAEFDEAYARVVTEFNSQNLCNARGDADGE